MGSGVAYREAGTGLPIVFLHGMGGGAASWDFQLEEFSRTHRAIAWDMPGYGGSAPIDPMTFEGLAAAPHRGTLHDDLLPGLRHVTLGRAVVWFDIVEETREVRVLAVFFGGQDHQRRMLARLLD